MAEGTRVYVPATVGQLETLVADGRLSVALATAVTTDLRAALPGMDEEELELEALLDAAELSLEQLRADPEAVPRRVVIAGDVPPGSLTPDPETGMSAVRLRDPLDLDAVAAVHVDEAAAVAAVAAGEVEQLDLMWFAPQEIEELLRG